MGLSVYFEDQNHKRDYAGRRIGECFEVLCSRAKAGDLLFGVHEYGDTMFNVIQIDAVMEELPDIESDDQELRFAKNDLRESLLNVIRSRGYIWISGD